MRAFIDANAIVHAWTLDVLLSAADADMFEPHWSIDVIREVERAFSRVRSDGVSAARAMMEAAGRAYPGALAVGYEHRIVDVAFNLSRMRQFYEVFPNFATLSQKLSWSHYLQVMRADGEQARLFYVAEAERERWSVRQLKRAIDTQLYERLIHTQEAKALGGITGSEKALTILGDLGGLKDVETVRPMATLKDPYVFEFLGIERGQKVLESELESALIDSLHDFLLELGRGFAFVGRQQRVSDKSNDYYIDLVFYNYFIKCFVLIDLKTHSLTAGDVGQMDFYMNLFDDQCKVEGDNPTIGMVLCTSRDETVAKYSVLSRNDNLYAAQYFPYLPTEEELETVLRRNRAEFEERIVRELSNTTDKDSE